MSRDNICGNDGNTFKNEDNTSDKSCLLKLNDIYCHVNSHVIFDAILCPSIIVQNNNLKITIQNDD